MSVPVSAIARLIGYTAYLGLSSLLLGENLLALAVVSVHSLLVSTVEISFEHMYGGYMNDIIFYYCAWGVNQ